MAWALASMLLALHAMLAWIARAPGIFSGDDVVYLLLARSLRSFRYEELFRVDHPVHRMYPPGYPALLSAWSAIGGERFDWLVWVGIGSSVVSLLLVFIVVKRKWGSALALSCLAALAFNAALIESSGWLASEAPFTMFALAALYALTRENERLAVPLACAAAIAAALTRTVGVTLIAAIAVVWLWRGQYRQAAAFASVAALTVGAWLLVSAAAPEQVVGRSYFADFSTTFDGNSVLHRVVTRLPDKLQYLPALSQQTPAALIPGTSIDNIAAMAVVGVACLVGVVALARDWPMAAAYLASYAALLAVWPWTQARFLLPLLPLIVVSIVVGAWRVATRLTPRWGLAAAGLLAAVTAVNGLNNTLEIVRIRRSCDRTGLFPSAACVPVRFAAFFDGARYVDEHVPRDAVFVSGRASALYHFTGRRTVSLTAALSVPPDSFLDFLRANHVSHVLLTAVMPFAEGTPAGGRTPLAEMVRTNCRQMRLEESFPPSTLLFDLAERQDGDADACRAVNDFIASYDRESRR